MLSIKPILSIFSVVAMETRQYVSGNSITMRLMRREKGSLVALPSSQWVKVEEPIHFEGEAFCCLHDIFVVIT